jgi:FAD-linked sulfhydryl oxidase
MLQVLPTYLPTYNYSNTSFLFKITVYVLGEEEKEAARNFFVFLSLLYPCRLCAADFTEYLEENPPQVNNRRELALYCCEMHNAVNRKLGFPTAPCDFDKLNERWGDGNPACNELDY